ncbi:sulfotransferase [Streptomyces sp. NPDC026673]|uniref:MmyB family transcriptional regulator n=1 Tax=Streptomyces sp. NPDC026673 TaxID=3155724 RepID=UPI0033C65280
MSPPKPAGREYQVLLRHYRKSRARTDIGLKTLPRTRNGPRPLRQADLDEALAGGAGVYQKFESGVLVPSPTYLRRVCLLLGFSDEDYYRAHRDLFPGRRPPHALNPRDEVSALWQRIVDGQAAMSCVIKQDGEIAACNTAFASLFPQQSRPSNLWRWLLLDTRARDHVLTDWDTAWASYLFARFELASTCSPHAQHLADLRDEVGGDDRLQKALAAQSRVPTGWEEETLPLHHPQHGPGTVNTMTAHLDRSPGARLITVLFTSGPPRDALTPAVRVGI